MFKPFTLLFLTSTFLFGQTGGQDKQALLAKIGDKDKALTWVITGDSITHGAWFTVGARSYPEHLAERVRGEMLRFRDIIINTGVSGEVSTGLLGDFDWRVLRFKPDVVSINLGMNDCARVPLEQHKKEMGEMITRAKQAGAIVILHATNTVYAEHGHAGKLPPFIEAVRQLAVEHDVMLVDHYKMFSEAKQGTEHRTWFADAIHPNGLGHAHMAAEMFRVIGIHDAESDTCKLAR
jgi:lysophospholipase L1-like esterase